MRILISNDDGIGAQGIQIIKNQFTSWGDVWVVAPETEKSTTGHSLTLHNPLRAKKRDGNEFAVNGYPADCVYLGCHSLLKKPPQLVLSGINKGANLGQDVYYSGTVAAAREAAVAGIPSIAFSLCIDEPKKIKELHWETAGKASVEAAYKILFSLGKTLEAGLKNFPKGTFFNVNVPNLPYEKIKGYKFATQGYRHYSRVVVKRTDSRGAYYYWIGGKYIGYKKIKGTDCDWIRQGYVSITKLHLEGAE